MGISHIRGGWGWNVKERGLQSLHSSSECKQIPPGRCFARPESFAGSVRVQQCDPDCKCVGLRQGDEGEKLQGHGELVKGDN